MVEQDLNPVSLALKPTRAELPRRDCSKGWEEAGEGPGIAPTVAGMGKSG